MTATCPNGHVSATDDYCDQCGARIGAAATASQPASTAQLAAAPGAGEATPPPQPAESCPRCATARRGDDRYCEGCGYDFASSPSAVGVAATWEAVASADRALFDRISPEGVSFPDAYVERRFPLTAEEVRIGRGHGQPPPGTELAINLAGSPEDLAISHIHAVLERQADGSYSLRDLGSTNGTTINDDPTPVSADAAAPLSDGDRIHIGAWTTITLRRM
ncbi:MAG: FHA domain-containing protein [Solirubrobacteraceae bacterium]